jgi:predicted GNAT family acetyltransferase
MEITITHQPGEGRGRYLAHVAGKVDPGRLTYLSPEPGRIIVDHIVVPESLRGNGVAAVLARHVVTEARAHGFRIVPQCSYMISQARKHPEWSDVVEPV